MSQPDYTTRGPLSTSKWQGRINIAPAGLAATVPLDLIVTYPTSGSAPFPIIFMFNGFQAKAAWYGGIVDHVSSWGYVLVQYTNGGLFPIVVDRIELTYLQPLLTWLASQSAQTAGPLAGRADPARLAAMGHSRGGKLAALHFAGRSDMSAAVLLDPIDGSAMTPEGPDYPSATKALAAGGKALGLIGAGITGSCNPVGQNFPKFYSALPTGTWQMVVQQAGHMQFARTGNFFIDWSLDRLCRRGSMASQDVISYSGAFAVAWFDSTFRATQAQAAVARFQSWAQSKVTAGDISFDVKPAATTATVAVTTAAASKW